MQKTTIPYSWQIGLIVLISVLAIAGIICLILGCVKLIKEKKAIKQADPNSNQKPKFNTLLLIATTCLVIACCILSIARSILY